MQNSNSVLHVVQYILEPVFQQIVYISLPHLYIAPFPDFPGGSVGEESACNAGDPGLIPGGEDPLEKEVATHSGILAWEIPCTEEPGGLQSMGSQELDMTEQLNRNHHHHPLPTGKH